MMNEDRYFKPAGDLSDDSGNKYFKPAGDLSDDSGNKYFKPAGDLDSFEVSIEDYVSSVVSGKRYPYESEMGIVTDAASTVVDFEQLKKMVDEGYNIVSAEVLNQDLIAVEFQCLSKNNNIGRGR